LVIIVIVVFGLVIDCISKILCQPQLDDGSKMLETNQNRPSAVYGSQYINTLPNNVAYPSNIITVTESVIHPYPSVPSSSIYGEQQPPSYKN
jgi:hypothetical protein